MNKTAIMVKFQFLERNVPCFPASLEAGKQGIKHIFESYQDCIEAGYATNVQNARRKIQRGDAEWRYAHLDRKGKPLRIPYKLKPGEISYKDLIKN